MKEIKAYIKPEKIDKLVHNLEKIGITDMTIIDVNALGTLRDPDSTQYSIEFVHKYSKVVKVEIICPDAMVDMIVECILNCAHTGLPGDGIITVYDIISGYRIREKKQLLDVPHEDIRG